MTTILALDRLSSERFETPAILKALTLASRKLAELKGVAASIPNQGILINTLGLQEAKDSSAIENIVTTHDELFKDDALPEDFSNAAAKEVLRYRQALGIGFNLVRDSGLLTTNHVLQIQAELERNTAGATSHKVGQFSAPAHTRAYDARVGPAHEPAARFDIGAGFARGDGGVC